MGAYRPSLELLERAASGDLPALSRLISRAEAGILEVRPTLSEAYRRAGRAHVVGLTGVPGSGKSTLVAHLVREIRKDGLRVGVVAIDPSSPYSGGAILGDRIRMSELAHDTGVFVRSMATRGATGGMARAALEAVDLLDVAGFELIIIETVGVGQDEVEVARASHTTVVVSAPGLGDEIQAIKAGILEIADIHVVSKGDRSDADRTVTDLKQMLTLGTLTATRSRWPIPVIKTSAFTGDGIPELRNAVALHRAESSDDRQGHDRQSEVATFRLLKAAENLLLEALRDISVDKLKPLAVALAERSTDPYSLASVLVEEALARKPGKSS